MSELSLKRRFTLAAAVAVATVLAAGCGSDSTDDDVSFSSEQPEGEDGEPTTSTTADSTTVTESTVSSTTETTEATLSAAEEEAAIKDQLLDVSNNYWLAYAECLGDTATCDVEASLDSYVAGQLKSELTRAVETWSTNGESFRNLDTTQGYRRHDVLADSPLTYALEICIMNGGFEVIRTDADGEVEVVEEAGPLSPEFQQLVMEETADGSLRIVRVLPNEADQVGAENCDEFLE